MRNFEKGKQHKKKSISSPGCKEYLEPLSKEMKKKTNKPKKSSFHLVVKNIGSLNHGEHPNLTHHRLRVDLTKYHCHCCYHIILHIIKQSVTIDLNGIISRT